MDAFFKVIHKAEKLLLIILIIALTIISFLQVFFRLVVQDPLAWSEEASRYLFVWATFLGAVVVLANNEHFKIDFVVELFPKNVQKYFICFSYLCVAVFAYILIVYGFFLQQSASGQLSPALRLNMMWVYSIIPITGVLMILHLIELIYKDITKKKVAS